MIKFNGMYIMGEGQIFDVFRFFEDGKVIFAGLNCQKEYNDIKELPKILIKWFNNEYINNGIYSIKDKEIIFTMNYENSMVTEFEGKIKEVQYKFYEY